MKSYSGKISFAIGLISAVLAICFWWFGDLGDFVLLSLVLSGMVLVWFAIIFTGIYLGMRALKKNLPNRMISIVGIALNSIVVLRLLLYCIPLLASW